MGLVQGQYLRRRARDALETIGAVAGDLIVSTAPLRALVSLVLRRRVARLESRIDDAFYLRQFRSPRRRQMAARGVALHYILVGWRERRAPNARFDPVYYRMHNVDMVGDPFDHLLNRGDAATCPQNEIEGRAAVYAASTRRPHGAVLLFHHARGGGSTKFLSIFEDGLAAEGFVPIRLRRVWGSDRIVMLHEGDGVVAFDLVEDRQRLIERLRAMAIERIVVSHVVDYEPNLIFEILTHLAAGVGCPFDVILHDYLCVCPRINLVRADLTPCAPIPGPDVCVRCVELGGSDIGTADPAAWRARFRAFLAAAATIYVPSKDMETTLAGFLPRPVTIWRPEREATAPIRAIALGPSERLRVCIVGSLNAAKGSRVVADLGLAIRAAGAPIDIELFGESPDHRILRRAGIRIHGRYAEPALRGLLAAYDPHVAFLPAIWPETWSFVLTALLGFGIPVVAFDHGAQSERLRLKGPPNRLLPRAMIDDPAALLAVFVELREQAIGERSHHHLADA